MERLLRPAGLLEDEQGLHLLTLITLITEKYGPDWLTYGPEGLRAILEHDYGTIGSVTWQRILAGQVLQSNSAFWEDWEVFEKVTAAIMGDIPDFSFVQPPETEEAAIAVYTAKLVDAHPYSDEVLRYIAAVCLHDGVWYLEPPLDIALPSMEAHDLHHHIQRDRSAVERRLKEVKTFIDDPQTPEDVQVNHVLSMRTLLAAYRKELDEQLLSLKK